MRLTFLLLLFSTSLFGQEMMLWSSVPASTEFSPSNIPSLELWLDAFDINADGSSSTGEPLNNTAITTWYDKSGNGNNAVGSSPIYRTNVISNSRPALDWDNDYLTTINNISNSQKEYTIFFIASGGYTSRIDYEYLFDSENPRTFMFQYDMGNDQSRFYINLQYYDLGVPITTDRLININLIEGTGTSNVKINSSTKATFDYNIQTFDNLHLGARFGGGNRYEFTGYIAEVIVYSKELTPQETSDVEDYLVNKWFGYPSGYVFCNNVITKISDVTSTTGRVWMDRNLGASQVATSSTDANAYGDLFQWGRFADGHQCRNPSPSTTTTLATTAVPNNGNSWDGLFITPTSLPYDWLSTRNDNLWQGVNGVNNPCPSGYRLPTEAEWQLEDNTFSPNNSSGAFASPLKLTLTGGFNGSFVYVGQRGHYWSSTTNINDAKNLRFLSSESTMRSSYRYNGFSIRCIKEETPLVQNDLVLHLDASDPASYPGTGTTWTDLSPEGNDGTIYGATFSNNTFVFDGVNDYVDVGNDASLNFGTGDFTVQVYYKRHSNSTTNLRLLAKGADNDDANTSRSGFGMWGSNNQLSFGVNPTGTRTILDVTGLTTDRDYLATGLVERGVSQRSYINTILEATATAPTGSVTGTQPLNLGRNPRSSNFYWDGEIKKVLIYNRALSEGEVKQNYNAMVYPYPPGYTPCEELTEIVDVTSTTGAVWMDRNLGASRVATSSTDAESYGDLYQWGRFADGHQCRNSATTSTNATTSVPFTGNSWDGLFILEPNSPKDWLTTQDDNLWQGVNGINNPCPSGYRIPTGAEWQAEDNTFSPNTSAGAFASPLKLPAPGRRASDLGGFLDVGSRGFYWASSTSTFAVDYLDLTSNTSVVSIASRANGVTVRCIKD